MLRREVPRVTIDASQSLGGFLPPSHRPGRNSVDIARQTPKRHRLSDWDCDYDYDYDNDNENDKENDKDCGRCSTCF